MNSQKRCVIVGAGVIGQTHALEAFRAGYDVTVIERDARPLGASVRNFGTLWPIGCRTGSEREQALEGVSRWKKLAPEVGYWIDPCGSLSLAYRQEAWEVLQEFGQNHGDDSFQLMTPAEVAEGYPLANLERLKGALFSARESVVQAHSTMTAMTGFLAREGVKMSFETPAIKVHDDEVETGDGRRFAFDQLVIAAGREMRVLFPNELKAAGIFQSRLQMMRTTPLAGGQRLGAVMVGDLTLCHYPAFENCASIGALRERLHEELPEHHAHGVHVIAAQHEDGSLTLGDSHEYGHDFDPGYDSGVESLILEALGEFTRLPKFEVRKRWHGIYLKSTKGITQVVLHPRENVTMVTAMGGLGMTLSWGLARRTVQSWF